jgi:hypothetical protein
LSPSALHRSSVFSIGAIRFFFFFFVVEEPAFLTSLGDVLTQFIEQLMLRDMGA